METIADVVTLTTWALRNTPIHRHSEKQPFEHGKNVFLVIPIFLNLSSLLLSPPLPSMLCPVCPYINKPLSLIWITIFDGELLSQDTWQICFTELIQVIIATRKNSSTSSFSARFLRHHIMFPANINMLEFNLIHFYRTLSNIFHEMGQQQRKVSLFLLLSCTWPK